MNKLFTTLAVGVLSMSSVAAFAADASCNTVRMADPGWSDIAATNATAGFLLDSLGYKAKIDTLAVPIAYGGLKDGQLDVFLGNWMPAQQGFYDKFIATGDVTQYAKNLEGTEFTLAVPDYVYDAGVHNFADLQKFTASVRAHRPMPLFRRSSKRMSLIWATGSWSSPVSRQCWLKCSAT
jgi:glycine betaine/proline transport system substrate-binding protein